ncbi:MAG: GIY-YIG nuclease family protein [Verrucomicrobiales bacterium]|nr:GIY-YIG nuclease family protein [Verrucomicrobiales bacterium]
MNPGYIYILQNPSLSESHLKIGRTERDPDERAAEISRATGVPTPFEVVWWSESIDCHLAETILHQHLDDYRTNTTREFFDLDLDEAIRVANRAIRQSGGRTGGLAYRLRRLSRWTFHSLARPLLRLPVQILLLVALVAWWVVKSALFLGWRLIRTLFLLPGALFSPSRRKSPRRRRRTSDSSRSRQSAAMAMQSNHCYWKETVGTILWISLIWFFLYEDGAARYRELISNSPLSDFVIPGTFFE